MDEPPVLSSPDHLRERLISLRQTRLQRHAIGRSEPNPRRAWRAGDREAVLRKTDNRCHNCGGTIVTRWEVDHVLAHAGGGARSVENCLPAHELCNNYRWDYDPEEFQWVLTIGVWARKQMEENRRLGAAMLARFFEYDTRRDARRSRKHEQRAAI